MDATTVFPGDENQTLLDEIFGDLGDESFNVSMSDRAAIRERYWLRFWPYTALFVCSTVFNFLSITAITMIRGQRTVHHTLLLNLACCDMMGSLLLWMYYNSPLLFSLFNVTTLAHCLFVVTVISGPFIFALCCSSLSLLALALNQFISICNPLFATTKISRGKAVIAIGVIWLISFTCAMIPVFYMLVKSRFQDCPLYYNEIGEGSIEICTYALAAVILTIAGLYASIYTEILRYRRRTPQLTNRRRNDETEHNYKAFVTTLLLAGTLVVYWLPYMAMHFISAHLDPEDVEQVSDLLMDVKFFVMDVMPMLSYLTDPVIYGIRMREIRFAYRRLFSKVLPCWVKEPVRGSVRSSVRFTTLDTTTVWRQRAGLPRNQCRGRPVWQIGDDGLHRNWCMILCVINYIKRSKNLTNEHIW